MDPQGSQDNCDWFSELHEPLIVQILSLLEMKDAVKTSVLSKRWKNIWTQVDTIVYRCDCEKGELGDKKYQQFISFVDGTLMQCTSPNIKKFSINVMVSPFDRNDCIYEPLDKWLEFVLAKNVKILELGRGLLYAGPSCLYHDPSIVGLKLDEVMACYLTDYISWPFLKKLYLKSLYFGEECTGKVLSGCPMLENLVLDAVRGMRHLNITSQNLKKLKLLNLGYDETSFDEHFGFVGFLKLQIPWVEKLEISGFLVEVDCQLIETSSLKYVNLIFNYSFGDYEPENAENPTGLVWDNIVNEILNRVCHVEEMALGSDLIQAMSLSTMYSLPPPKFKCKHLTLFSSLTLGIHEVPGVLCLLQNMPHLESLVWKIAPLSTSDTGIYKHAHSWESHLTVFYNKHLSFDVVAYLSSQHGNFQNLKSVKIDYVGYLSDDMFDQLFDIEIVAYIVRNAPALKKLVIDSSNSTWSEWPIVHALHYAAYLSSETMVGEKAKRWELKVEDHIVEFYVCDSS